MSDWIDAEGHADRALEMYERGRWADAEIELRKALALNPDQAEWHFNLGLTLEASGRDREAVQSFEKAIDLMPGQPEPLVAAGAAAARLDDRERAEAWLLEALRLDRTLEPAYAHLIDLHLRVGNHDEAETTFYLAQQSLPESSAQCLALVAESLIERGDFERARWCLREALRLDPGLPRLRARLAMVAAATGRPQRALQLYLRDLRDDPGSIDTLLDYGELLMDLGRLPEAAEKFRRVLELEPANVDAHERLGRIAMRGQRYEQAHLELELVFKLDPSYPQLRMSLAEVLLKRGQVATARAHLQEELADQTGREGKPARAEVMVRLGSLLLEADAPGEAVTAFDKACLLEVDSPDVLRKLALARFQSGDRDGGVAASRRVVRLDPCCVVSMHNLALAAIQEGQLLQARRWVARGLAIERQDEALRRLRVRIWLAWLPWICAQLIPRRRKSRRNT